MRKLFGNGQGGKSLQDRELAAKVRELTLNECYKHLKKGKGKLYEALLIRLAGTALPRLNEHTGRDGEDLPVPIINLNGLSTHNGNQEGIATE